MCKKRLITFIRIYIFLMILPSCTYKSQDQEPTSIPSYLIDRSWLIDEPCRAPCWYGLEPGKSTKTEAISTVKELSFINPDSMMITELDTSNWDGSEHEGIPSQGIMFEYKNFPRITCINMQIERDILSWFLLLPLFNVSFGQVVDQIGPPDYFAYSPIYPEGRGCDVKLLWVDRQMELTHVEGMRGMFGKDLCDRIKEANNKIPPELNVFQVIYMQTSDVEGETSEKKYIPWVGFMSPSP